MRALASISKIAFLGLFAACGTLGKDTRDLPPHTIEGASWFSHQRLREAVLAEVGEAVREEWIRSGVDDGAFAIERLYASEGFANARVDYEIVKDPSGRERAIFRVEEGPRVALESLEFKGAASLRRETLEGFFPKLKRSSGSYEDSRDDSRQHRAGPPWWIESQLNSAAEDLEDHYYKSGYLEARVAPPATRFDAGGRGAHVLVEIAEGVRSTLAKVELEGAPEPGRGALQRAADSFVGRPYSPLLAGALRGKLEEALNVQGYPDAKATAGSPEHAADGETTLSFAIEPGPRVRIASIEIRGTKRTRRSTVLGMLKLSPGDVYDVEKERESFRALYQSGLFSTVELSLEPGTQEERVWIVEVSEASSVEFYVEPGYGSYERFRVGLGGRYKNLFGTGRMVEVDTTVAELAQAGRISLITPRVLGSEVRSTVSVFTNRREEPSFTSRETGVGWTFARRMTRRLSATLGYEFRRTSVSNVDIVGPAVQALINAVEISSIALTPVYDTRDSVFAPAKGSITKATFEVADAVIGSELDFLRLRLAWSKYFSPWEAGVLAFSWRAGLIAPIHSSSAIPLQERFFNGGENTVRSFREDQLGPTDALGNPVGGEAYHVVSAELRQRLTGNLEGALFVDTGNVQLEYTDFFDGTGFRAGYGFGIRYVLPIGPIRLDYGINPDPRQGESSYVLHFTVGMAF